MKKGKIFLGIALVFLIALTFSVMSFSGFSKEITSEEIKETTCTTQSYKIQPDSFTSEIINNAVGITTDGETFWITDNENNFVHHLDKQGNELDDGFSLTPAGITNPIDITTDGTDFWIVEHHFTWPGFVSNFVYHLDKQGNELDDGFSINIPEADFPMGITTDGETFWITYLINASVRHFDKEGNNLGDGFLTGTEGIALPYGITTNGKELWIVDNQDSFLYHFDSSGNIIDDRVNLDDNPGINLPLSVTSDKELSSGNPENFWIIDFESREVYHIALTEEEYTPGNIDNSEDQKVDMADLTYLISYLYLDPTLKIPIPKSADMNGDGLINKVDLDYLIDYLFINFDQEPVCGK